MRRISNFGKIHLNLEAKSYHSRTQELEATAFMMSFSNVHSLGDAVFQDRLLAPGSYTQSPMLTPCID